MSDPLTPYSSAPTSSVVVVGSAEWYVVGYFSAAVCCVVAVVGFAVVASAELSAFLPPVSLLRVVFVLHRLVVSFLSLYHAALWKVSAREVSVAQD